MGHTTVVHFPGNFRQVHLIINQELFYPVYFMVQVVLFNSGTLDLTEEVMEIFVIVVQLFTEVV